MQKITFLLLLLSVNAFSQRAKKSQFLELRNVPYNLRGELSDIACHRSDTCAVSSDEGNELLLAKLVQKKKQTKAAFSVESKIRLDYEYRNLDIEGIAAYENGYFAVGSHSKTKDKEAKAGEMPGYYRFYQVTLNEEKPEESQIRIGTLSHIIAAIPELAEYQDKYLAEGGVNIEGLAYSNGILYFGLKNPRHNLSSRDDEVYVLETSAEAPFDQNTTEFKLQKIRAFKGTQITEMEMLGESMIVLSRNSSVKNGQEREVTHIYELSKFGSLNDIVFPYDSRLDRNDRQKQAEGMALYPDENSSCRYKVMVLYDESKSVVPKLEVKETSQCF